MFHHNDRVAEVAQLFKAVYQTLVVTLMQSDTWLIKYVKHIYKLRTDLCCKSYALALSSRECRRLSVQRQIVESHLKKEIESCAYLFYYFFRNGQLFRLHVAFSLVEPFLELTDVHVCQLRYVLVPYAIGERFAF